MTGKQAPEGWQLVKFGDIAKSVSKRVEPSKTELEKYVGLEHLDSDSLKIKRHGVPSDVKGQKLLVRKGQIIFGKRRAYQRKVAVADWDCICSAHAMVLEAIPEKILPKFLPFLMQSDVFMNRAMKISEGSLSPTIKWKTLEQQTFAIPGKIKQTALLNLLKTTDVSIEAANLLLESAIQNKKALQHQIYKKEIRMKSDDGSSFPEWKERQLKDLVSPIKRKADSNVENVMTISAGKGFLMQEDRFNRVIAGSSLKKYNHLKKNEFSYNRGNSKTYSYGCVYMLKEEEALVLFVYRSFKLNVGVAEFYAQLFENKYLDSQLRRIISSSARMDGLLNINEKDFYKVKVPQPVVEEQRKIADFIERAENLVKASLERASKLHQLKRSMLNELISPVNEG